MANNCELCDILNKIQTTLYHKHLVQKDSFIVINCKTCKTPMVVFLNHHEPSEEGLKEAIDITKQIFPKRKVDLKRRKIPDHPHFHMR